MRKILIPTDFSENALNALKYAVEVFKYERCDFFIIHAYADEVYDKNAYMTRALFEEIKELLKRDSDRELLKIKEILKDISPNPKHSYNTESVFDNLIDGCNSIVDNENIDMIVMGTKGKTEDRKLTFGSNTLQVLKYVKCPVLAIPNESEYIQPKKIVFTTNYLLPYKRRELKLLNTMARSFRSELHCLYISDFEKLSIRQEDNKAFLEEALKDTLLTFHRQPRTDLTNSINEYIENHKIDLLVMVNSRHSYLEGVLYQSVIDRIGLHIKIPFLVMQNFSRT